MPCLVALIALLAPRIVIIALWLVTEWFTGVFDAFIWPLVGFLFMPFTMLWYSAVVNWYGGQWGTLQIVVMVIAVLADLSPSTVKRGKK
ncbi:MAG: hypothetical protein RhofKO_09310 [Rhodothermales bacterium]